MSPVFILFCLLAVVGAIAYGVYNKWKAESLQSETDAMRQAANDKQTENTPKYENAIAFIEDMGKRHQFTLEELEKKEPWATYLFTYQGGHFVCHAGTQANILQLQFRGVASLKYTPENYEKIRSLCHRVSNEYLYAKVVYEYDAENNELDIHILIETVEPTEQAFMMYIDSCFQMGHVVRQELSKEPTITDAERIENQRDYRMLLDAEMAHEAERLKAKHPTSQAPNHGTLGEYLRYLFGGEEVEDLLSLTIQNANGTTTIRQRDEIAKYDLLSAAIDTNGEVDHFVDNKEFSSSVLTVNTVRNHYVFTLHPLEDKENILSVRMTAVCTPHEFVQDYVPDSTYIPKAVSMLLCYIKTELPTEDGETEDDLELPKTNMGAQIRHGHLLMEQRCCLQAIAVLSPIFNQLKTQVYELSEKDKNTFLLVGYYIGFCYTELHIYDRAYYYLELAHRIGDRFDFSQEYINCLANGSDPRVFYTIDEELKTAGKEIERIDKEEDSGTEQLVQQRQKFVSYTLFLLRRKGYAQINFGYLDAAEETFKGLLDNEECHDYAQNELEYITRLRLQQMRKDNTPKKSDIDNEGYENK